MGEKSVDRAAMQKATQQIETKHQQIHALQTRLQGQMVDLGSRWRSNSSTVFQQGYQQFDSEFEKVKQGLDQIHTSLVQTLREYGMREEENQATANQISGLING